MYLCLRTFLDFSIFLFLTQSLYWAPKFRRYYHNIPTHHRNLLSYTLAKFDLHPLSHNTECFGSVFFFFFEERADPATDINLIRNNDDSSTIGHKSLYDLKRLFSGEEYQNRPTLPTPTRCYFGFLYFVLFFFFFNVDDCRNNI